MNIYAAPFIFILNSDSIDHRPLGTQVASRARNIDVGIGFVIMVATY